MTHDHEGRIQRSPAPCIGPVRRRRAGGARQWLSRNVVRYLGRGGLGEADLLSYLYFDRSYAEHLLALGRKDAEAATDNLVAFFR